MNIPENIGNYLRRYASELGDRILQTYPALHNPGDPVLEARIDSFADAVAGSRKDAGIIELNRIGGMAKWAIEPQCNRGCAIRWTPCLHDDQAWKNVERRQLTGSTKALLSGAHPAAAG